MSIKGQMLQYSIVPQVASNYMVLIPGIIDAPLRCHTTSLPSVTRNENVISVSGQPVYIPGKTQIQGTWSCTLYESELGDVYRQVALLRKSQMLVNDVTDTPMGYKFFNIHIFLLNSLDIPVVGRVLGGSWLVNVEPLNLDASTPDAPVSYVLTFRYQTCKDI